MLNGAGNIQSKLTEETDDDLVRSAQRGDLDAFGELVVRYQQRVYSLAYGMTGNHNDADDLAQEVFLKTFRAIKKFRFQSSFYTWLYRIAVNTIITRRKKLKAAVHLELNPQVLEIQGSPYLPAGLRSKKGDKEVARRELQDAL